ncbi:5-methyltetrahydrofolate--homocysteine methyltransferase [Desulfofundulus australicus DSM 11792]|uniref:5-methyltetrahydrofolate--homocysteine methyltransferase n=1 Tax=Desulfofundulus australicus DSM 11792 TaxID=1121425 RepID=A0A1M5AJW8_9FIRM|nr:methyltetrahydrofolate cobalamin methyltransferase [Desulfofundulus australicus]SHF30434.1 5-methyltetrahydrofolate--homocysteine methyltransferase [Desulfofundulus australicus DSM 11792]
MLIIGERINSTRKSIDRAVRTRDVEFIRQEATNQVNAGAHMLDVNCGTLEAQEEPAAMEWLVQTVQAAVDVPLCIDSPNYKALAAGLAVHRGKAMINSISGETERYKNVLPLVKEYGAAVVALCTDDRGIPASLDQALEVGLKLVGNLLEAGVPVDDIFFDPLVRSVATNPETVLVTLRLMEEMSARFPGLHFVSGLSNVSFGLPERRHLNRAYAVMSMASGLDAVIADPLDRTLMALIYATEALLNKDRFCMQYIRCYQEGKLKG